MSTTLACLAFAIYMESKGEPTVGQEAVGEVVLNRSKQRNYPDNPCGVVRQRNQFSWYNKNIDITKEPNNKNPEQWKKAKIVAERVLNNTTNHTKGSLFFNTKNLGVRYKTKVSPCVIGNHIFY